MSDSVGTRRSSVARTADGPGGVDRVFSHALSTVNKIRSGSQKPPPSTRLKMYGLYKQAMEGDVDGIVDMPQGQGEEAYRAREKWNAWKQQGGISRTEAKRRYITTVLDAMHMYASPSPDSRELVTELEFVWDQVKSNVPSASSPAVPSVETGARGLRSYAPLSPTEVRQSQLTQTAEDAPLQLRSPISQSEEADGADEFVDAQDSQYVLTAEVDEDAMPEDAKDASRDAAAPDPKWRQRVEQTLVRMTAEVAALREQLAERRLFTPSRQWTLVGWVWRLFKSSLKHAVVDVVLIGILLLWMRWRQDGRLEGAVRASIGHAALGMQHASSSRLGLSTPVSIAGKAMRSRGQQTRG